MTSQASESLQTVPPTVPNVARIVPRQPRGKRRDPLRGFCVVKPSKEHGQPFYRIRYTDPDSQAKGTPKPAFRRIPAEHGGDPEVKVKDAPQLRARYRAQVAEEIRDRRKELKAGRAEPMVDPDALIEFPAPTPEDPDARTNVFELHYFATRGVRKRPKTLSTYRCAIRAFLAWCATAGVRTLRHITAAKLAEYRDHAASRPAKDDGELREAKSVNNELKAVGTILRAMAKQRRIQLSPAQVLEALDKEDDDDSERGPIQPSEALRAIIAACIAHDASLGVPQPKRRGRPPAQRPLLATFLFLLLTGLRPKEAWELEWSDVGIGVDGSLEITVRKDVSKTKQVRRIGCGHSPLLARLLGHYERRSGRILGGSTYAWEDARYRLTERHSAPAFTSRELRRTCGTFLACAPGIFAAASAYMAARQLGHSVKIAEQHYLSVVHVSRDARTTEAAMGIFGERASASETGARLASLDACPQL